MESPFDILKKIGVVNFEWVELVRDLRTAEARIQELQAGSLGEYVVYCRRTQQVVARFKPPIGVLERLELSGLAGA
jgi:hypothetical protein